MKLPGEIRNMIYDFCLVPDNYSFQIMSFLQESPKVYITRAYFGKICKGVLFMNKQIHREAASRLYGHTFQFEQARDVLLFMKAIGKHAVYLRKVEYTPSFRDESYEIHLAISAFAAAKSLEKLVIRGFRCRRYDSPEVVGKLLATKIFQHASHWFTMVARAKGSPTAGLDIIDFHPRDLEPFRRTRRFYPARGIYYGSNDDERLVGESMAECAKRRAESAMLDALITKKAFYKVLRKMLQKECAVYTWEE
jgi:hypothetical protein